MTLISIFLAAAIAQADIPPVPGLCSAPIPADPETPGCYQTNELDLRGAPQTVFWQVYEFSTQDAAVGEAKRHRWAAVARIHAKQWLYVLGGTAEHVSTGTRRALIGPLTLPAGAVTAHFSEAIFPPGMRTRVHSHPGPEAFYVVEGEQCMETPTDKRVISAGGAYVVESGPHLQAAPKGRRNLVLILAPTGRPWVLPGSDWKPTGFCDE